MISPTGKTILKHLATRVSSPWVPVDALDLHMTLGIDPAYCVGQLQKLESLGLIEIPSPDQVALTSDGRDTIRMNFTQLDTLISGPTDVRLENVTAENLTVVVNSPGAHTSQAREGLNQEQVNILTQIRSEILQIETTNDVQAYSKELALKEIEASLSTPDGGEKLKEFSSDLSNGVLAGLITPKLAELLTLLASLL